MVSQLDSARLEAAVDKVQAAAGDGAGEGAPVRVLVGVVVCAAATAGVAPGVDALPGLDPALQTAIQGQANELAADLSGTEATVEAIVARGLESTRGTADAAAAAERRTLCLRLSRLDHGSRVEVLARMVAATSCLGLNGCVAWAAVSGPVRRALAFWFNQWQLGSLSDDTLSAFDALVFECPDGALSHALRAAVASQSDQAEAALALVWPRLAPLALCRSQGADFGALAARLAALQPKFATGVRMVAKAAVGGLHTIASDLVEACVVPALAGWSRSPETVDPAVLASALGILADVVDATTIVGDRLWLYNIRPAWVLSALVDLAADRTLFGSRDRGDRGDWANCFDMAGSALCALATVMGRLAWSEAEVGHLCTLFGWVRDAAVREGGDLFAVAYGWPLLRGLGLLDQADLLALILGVPDDGEQPVSVFDFLTLAACSDACLSATLVAVATGRWHIDDEGIGDIVAWSRDDDQQGKASTTAVASTTAAAAAAVEWHAFLIDLSPREWERAVDTALEAVLRSLGQSAQLVLFLLCVCTRGPGGGGGGGDGDGDGSGMDAEVPYAGRLVATLSGRLGTLRDLAADADRCSGLADIFVLARDLSVLAGESANGTAMGSDGRRQGVAGIAHAATMVLLACVEASACAAEASEANHAALADALAKMMLVSRGLSREAQMVVNPGLKAAIRLTGAGA